MANVAPPRHRNCSGEYPNSRERAVATTTAPGMSPTARAVHIGRTRRKSHTRRTMSRCRSGSCRVIHQATASGASSPATANRAAGQPLPW